jgi:Flp pilus assembly protein TadD
MQRAPFILNALLSTVTVVVLEACAAPSLHPPAISDADLLSGNVLNWNSSSAPLPSRDDAFGLDEDMRAFVASVSTGDASTRLNGLLDGMRDGGLLSLHYTDDFTRTASGTFHDRVGNCLSFTMLFVGLARAAGLDVRYQVVDVPPTWTDDLGLIAVGNHVNALVLAPPDHGFIVDFNDAFFREKYPTRIVSDDYAAALYYNNLGAEALGRRDNESSFALLREAARIDRDMAATWVNLGVLYLRLRHLDYAEAALLRALETDPREQSAFTNLESVYTALGHSELAARYGAQIRRYRDSNPYYHYAVARAAFNEKRYDDALPSLRTAIRLKGDDEEFYSLQGQVLVALGHEDRAVESFARAKELATGQ